MSKNYQFDSETNNSGYLKEEHYTSPFVFSVAYLGILTETKQGKTDYKSNDFFITNDALDRIAFLEILEGLKMLCELNWQDLENEKNKYHFHPEIIDTNYKHWESLKDLPKDEEGNLVLYHIAITLKNKLKIKAKTRIFGFIVNAVFYWTNISLDHDF